MKKTPVVKSKLGEKELGKEESSYKIFERFIKYSQDRQYCDASGIIGKACYQKWVKSRRQPPKVPHEAFRRAVTAHIRANDGRKPFPELAERSLLAELRKKKQWDAFRGTEMSVGVKGFSSEGFHEKRRKERTVGVTTPNNHKKRPRSAQKAPKPKSPKTSVTKVEGGVNQEDQALQPPQKQQRNDVNLAVQPITIAVQPFFIGRPHETMSVLSQLNSSDALIGLFMLNTGVQNGQQQQQQPTTTS